MCLRFYINAKSPGKLLDIGSGAAPYKDLYRDDIEIIDIDNNASRNPTVVGDAHALPFENNSFEYITCYEVLEHVLDPSSVTKEISRVMIPGGICGISAPMSWGLHYEPFDFRRFTKYGLRKLMEDNDLEVIYEKKIGGLYSFFFSRNLDLLFTFLRSIPPISLLPYRGHIIVILFSPVTLALSLLCYILDFLSKEDAIGWFVIAKKKA